MHGGLFGTAIKRRIQGSGRSLEVVGQSGFTVHISTYLVLFRVNDYVNSTSLRCASYPPTPTPTSTFTFTFTPHTSHFTLHTSPRVSMHTPPLVPEISAHTRGTSVNTPGQCIDRIWWRGLCLIDIYIQYIYIYIYYRQVLPTIHPAPCTLHQTGWPNVLRASFPFNRSQHLKPNAGSNPGWVKVNEFKMYTGRHLAWCSILLGQGKEEWTIQYSPLLKFVFA